MLQNNNNSRAGLFYEFKQIIFQSYRKRSNVLHQLYNLWYLNIYSYKLCRYFYILLIAG